MSGLKQTSSKQASLILTAAVSLVSFLIIAYSLNLFNGLNLSVNTWATNLSLAWLAEPASIISYFFDTMVLLFISVAVAGILVLKSHVGKGLLLLGAMGIDAVVLTILKDVVASPRPLNGLVVEDGYSFPSGHVTTTIVFFGMLTYFAWQNRKSLQAKIGLAVITPTLAVIVGFNRLYLNVHWFSDILAALFLAVFLLTVSILVWKLLSGWYTKRGVYAAHSGSLKPTLCVRVEAPYSRAITPQSQ